MMTLDSIVEIINKDPKQMHVDNDGFILTSALLDTANAATGEELSACIRVLNQIFSHNSDLPEMPRMFASKLLDLGLKAYIAKDYHNAEELFRILSTSGEIDGKNNLAYMIRRGETSDTSPEQLLYAVRILKDGIESGEPFSYVNQALLFSLCFGSDTDWHLSDDLMEALPDTKIENIQTWWQDVANEGDIEGVLVHYYLLRHKKIKSSTLGLIEDLSATLSEKLEAFPDWLVVQPRFKSLDDVFETMLDDDFEDNLSRFLDKMPRNREAADEILEEITQWDEWELYRVLLQDYTSFLTPEEIQSTIRAYKKKFMIPLSSIIDEASLISETSTDTED